MLRLAWHVDASRLMQRRPADDDRVSWRVCVHEIGHALAVRSAGHKVMSAHAFPGDEGTCRWSPEAPLDFRDALMITCAGVAAERVALGVGEFDVAEKLTARSWIESIRGISRGTLKGALDELPEFIHATTKATRLLRGQRGLLEQIARQLGRNESMTGDEIEAIATSRSPKVLRERLDIELNAKWYP